MTPDPDLRLAIILIAALLKDCGCFSGERSSPPRRRGGGDLLEEFTLKAFCDWIRHELEDESHRWWKIKRNGVGVPASQAAAAD